MAKVKIQGNASGTGVLTVTAPNTSTDRTITLPDATGTLATTADVPAGISSSADATAITISSSEDVGINHSTGFGTYSGTGVKYSKGDGTFFVGRDGGQPLWLNRETSQGDLIGLAAAGSTHARIGTDSNDLVFKTGTGGNTECMRINSDGYVTMPKQPSCAVGRNSNQGSGSIEWNYVNYNIGNHFNTSTARFTAPVAGQYLVQIFAMTSSNLTLELAVRINGNNFDGFVPYSSSTGNTHNAVSASTIIGLSANDYLIAYVNNGNIYGGTGGRHTGFSVHLLS